MQGYCIAVMLLSLGSSIQGDNLLNPVDHLPVSSCDQLYGLVAYPRVMTNITVIRTAPLRVRVHLLAQGPSTSIPFSVEGMVCQKGFDQQAAEAACRSQNFNNAVMVPNIQWEASVAGLGQECILDTKACKSVIPCEYILHSLRCPESAVNLVECDFPTLFTKSDSCNRSTHVGLICT